MGHPIRLELTRVGLFVECFSGFVSVYIEVSVVCYISLPPPPPFPFSRNVSTGLSLLVAIAEGHALPQLVFDI